MKVLAADIGGTNTRIAIVEGEKIVHLKTIPTQEIKNFSATINDFLESTPSKPSRACLAAAGIVQGDVVTLTQVNLTVDVKEIKKKTPLQHVILINDVVAVSYAIPYLKKKDYVTIRKGTPREGNIACVAIGTGLGQSVIIPTPTGNLITPSEAGGQDLAVHTEEELRCMEFIRHKHKTSVVSYGMVLCGNGLESLYEFFADEHLPAEVVASKKNAHARQATQLFKKFFARHCKNMVIGSLAVGGVYIAGGIPMKNQNLLDKIFLSEFEKIYPAKFREELRKIPVYLITNEHIGILGAAQALEVSQ